MVAEQVGLPTSGRRRVPGLRREEVGVLAAARPARRTSARRKDAQVPPRVQWMLDSITMSAAFVRNGRHDIIAHNAPARTLLAPIFDSRTTAQHGRANIARYVFLDPGARRFFVDWDEATTASAALLRAQAGREPHDRALRDLIGEPSTLSTAFRSQWAAHDGRLHHNGSKRLWHPEVGRLERPPRPHTPPPSPVEEAPSIVGFLGLWRARMPVLAVRPADLRRLAGPT